MKLKSKLLSTAMVAASMLAISAAHAETQTNFTQSNALNLVVEQNIPNVTVLDSEIEIALEGVSTQFNLNQYNVIGAGTGTSASFNSAVTVNDPSIVVNQSLIGQQLTGTAGSFPVNGWSFPGVVQVADNLVDASVDPDGRAIGNIELNGVSQIGVNQMSVASVKAVNTADVLVQQSQQVPVMVFDSTGYSNTDYEVGGTFVQSVNNSIVAELYGTGSSIIDGAYTTGTGEDAVTNSSVQYGVNGLNNAYVALQDGGSISLGQRAGYDAYYSDNGSGGYADVYGGYSSQINNQAVAYSRDTEAPRGGVVFDPAVRNLDQIAVTSVNQLNVQSNDAFALYGSVAGEGGYSAADVGQTFRAGEMTRYGLPDNWGSGGYTGIGMQNFALAANGTNYSSGGYGNWDEWGRDVVNIESDGSGGYGGYTGGFGDSFVTNVGQTISLGINAVSVVGELTSSTTDAATARDPAGAVTLGANINNYNTSFVQKFDGELRIEAGFRSDSNPRDVLEGLEESDAQYYTSPWESADTGNSNNLGNAAYALTGTGNAAVNGIDQLQAVTVNSFSTSGGVVGASTTVPFENHVDPDLVQTATDDVYVRLENAALALVTVDGDAAASGSQTLAFTLNSFSAGGTTSGILNQNVGYDSKVMDLDVDLQNTLAAGSFNSVGNGSVTIGNPAGSSVDATPVSQTIVSSINTMAIGGATNLVVNQTLNGYVQQTGGNLVEALASGGIDAANINQTVLNRLNTISANIPAGN